MASRKVSFSLEDRNGSVTALAAVNGALFAGTREGVINSFSIESAYIMKSSKLHQSTVTSLTHLEGIMYSTGLDGIDFGFQSTDTSPSAVVFDARPVPITNMVQNKLNFFAIKDEPEIIILPRLNDGVSVRSLESTLPLVCIAANEEMIFAGSKAGSIVAWNATSLQDL